MSTKTVIDNFWLVAQNTVYERKYNNSKNSDKRFMELLAIGIIAAFSYYI